MSFHSARSKASVEGSLALQTPAEGFVPPHFGGNEQKVKASVIAKTAAFLLICAKHNVYEIRKYIQRSCRAQELRA